MREPGTGNGIDMLSFHATRNPTGVVREYSALGAEMMWMLDTAPETLEAVGKYEPRYVITSEGLLFRRWEES